VLATFLDGQWTPIPERLDTIPTTQNGMGILSYLKFHELRGSQDSRFLRTVCAMGDYLVREALTPASGRYPSFTRSTGKRDQFPLAADWGVFRQQRLRPRDRAGRGRERPGGRGRLRAAFHFQSGSRRALRNPGAVE